MDLTHFRDGVKWAVDIEATFDWFADNVLRLSNGWQYGSSRLS